MNFVEYLSGWLETQVRGVGFTGGVVGACHVPQSAGVRGYMDGLLIGGSDRHGKATRSSPGVPGA